MKSSSWLGPLVGPMVAGCAAVACLSATPAQLQGQTRVGLELDFANDYDLGLGGRVVFPLEGVSQYIDVEGSFIYFFPSASTAGIGGVEADVNYWEMNGNIRFSIPISDAGWMPYLGVGLNLAHASSSVSIGELGGGGGSSTDVGINILGGAMFGGDFVRPFAEIRYEAGGGDQFILRGGLTVPVGS